MFPDAQKHRKDLFDDSVEFSIHTYPRYSSEVSGNNKYVLRVISALKTLKQKFAIKKPDFIIGAGFSGCGLGSIISYIIDTPLVLLRNAGTTRAGPLLGDSKFVTPNTQVADSLKTFWFVDDLIETGGTFVRCMDAASQFIKTHGSSQEPECSGVILASGAVSSLDKFKQEIISQYLNGTSFVLSADYDNEEKYEVVFGDGRQECI